MCRELTGRPVVATMLSDIFSLVVQLTLSSLQVLLATVKISGSCSG